MNVAERLQEKTVLARGAVVWRCLAASVAFAGLALAASGQQAEAAPEKKESERFPGIGERYLPVLEEVDKMNPKLVPAWLEVRRLQADYDRCFATFGRQARRNAEREMQTIERALERATKTFTTEFERVCKPWQMKEEGLRVKAAKLSDRKPEFSEERQKARDAEVSSLYAEAMEFYDKISSLSQLQHSVTIDKPLTRMDQVGAPRGAPFLDHLSKEEKAELLQLHLALKDTMTDFEEAVKFKEANADKWGYAEEQKFLAAERELQRGMDFGRRTVAKLKRPHESEKTKLERRVENLAQRVERAKSGSKMSDKLNLDLMSAGGELEKHVKALEAIDAFGGWAELDAKWPAN